MRNFLLLLGVEFLNARGRSNTFWKNARDCNTELHIRDAGKREPTSPCCQEPGRKTVTFLSESLWSFVEKETLAQASQHS